jgi:RHS repeat-associated protein
MSGNAEYESMSMNQKKSRRGKRSVCFSKHWKNNGNFFQRLENSSIGAFGQLVANRVEDSVGNNVLSQSYQRSLTGSIQTKTTDSEVWNYGYDLTDQLTNALLSATGRTDQTWDYIYDAMGNRIQESEVRSQGSEITDYVANELNQYTSISNSSPTPQVSSLLYDLNGNMTNDSVRAYSWDTQNQLTKVEPLISTNGSLMVEFAYDYMGRRIQKEVYTRVADAWSLTTDRWFFYDGWNLVREDVYDNSITPILQYSTTYTWGNDLSGSLQGAGGVGGLLCSVRSQSGSSPEAFYYCYDHNGNVEKIIRGSGAVVAEYQYDAFGNTIQESIAQGLESKDFPIRFSTKYWDAECSLYYYGYRYYSPGLGRWIKRDPSGEKNMGDIYLAMMNNPLEVIDYTGLFDLPNNWMTRFYNKYHSIIPITILPELGSMLMAQIRILNGDDPWIIRFMENYFFGSGKTITLSQSDVRSLYTVPKIINFENESDEFFITARRIPETQSKQLFQIARIGNGNLTLGDFHLRYEGDVDDNCTFRGTFKISDSFNFNWRKWGERAIKGELELRLFTILTAGIPFTVDSQPIYIQQRYGEVAEW